MNSIALVKDVSDPNLIYLLYKIDGDDITIKWEQIKKIGEIVLIGNSNTDNQQVTSGANCPNCNFSNSSDSKFCESCGAKL